MNDAAPAKVDRTGEIPVRDIHFDLAAAPLRWHGCGNGVTQFYDALSACFPLGEGFFIRSVKRGAASINEAGDDVGDNGGLKAAVRGFAGQEFVHSREHRAYNKRLSDAGYDIGAMEAAQAKTIAWIENDLGGDAPLGVTACMEHMTSVLAEQLTHDDAYLEKAHPVMRDLWVWHAMEEAEHGAVAFDVFARKRRGYFYRVWLMILSTLLLLQIFSRNYGLIAAKDRAPGATREMLRYLFWSPGFLRRSFAPYLRWYLPGFHPLKGKARSRAARHRERFDLLARNIAKAENASRIG